MDVKGTIGKLTGMAEDNAAILAFLGSSYARAAENTWGEDPIGYLTSYFTFTRFDSKATNIVTETLGSLTSLNQLKYKLWTAPHYNTMIFKAAAIGWAIGKFAGVLPERYTRLLGKIALGAGASAIVMCGSGPVTTNSIASKGSSANPITGKYGGM